MKGRISYKVGELVEHRISAGIEHFFEAPLLAGSPRKQTWYRVPVEGGRSGDGSEYHIYIKIADLTKLCIFLSGGGVAWNEYTAARPVTGGAVAAGLPNYYWNNLRPFTQIMNINAGITEIGNRNNPFDEWSFVVITYATGDFHIGNNVLYFSEEKQKPGTEKGSDTEKIQRAQYFYGHRNFRESMRIARLFFPAVNEILMAGDSAGAFAVPALAGEVADVYYPECDQITLLSDSGQLLFGKWQETICQVWKSERKFYQAVHGPNLTVEWYRALYEKYGDRFTYLYAGSTHDYLLSAYMNDMLHQRYESDAEMQALFFAQLQEMVISLKEITPAFGIYIYPWKNPLLHVGGTIHTVVRKRHFYSGRVDGKTMAEWLGAAVCGQVEDCGLSLLMQSD